ncbi:MAG: chemotaxis protein CheX [Leptospirales bacterium]|nr:chemotaxis protein CheX [Leptospirales bacterium]
MKAELINPILAATAGVLRQLAKLEVVRGRSLLLNNPRPSHEVAIFVGITGAQSGHAIYSMNYESALKLAARLMPGSDEALVRSEYRDALGEVANMITGVAIQQFMRGAAGVDLTTPMVADLRHNAAPDMPDMPTLALNLYTVAGLIEIHFAMK